MGIKLTRLEIRSYRSILDAQRIDLASGANVVVGPNNVGKSNLVRAISLAFGEGAAGFDLERDAPAMALWGRPTITLDMRIVSPVRGFEKTLLKHAEKAEKAVLRERKEGIREENVRERRPGPTSGQVLEGRSIGLPGHTWGR